mmetsp:Transcript_27366/g.38520  ORF Transcript_27366/g.38520 Transcript_27366/m.38520 type:complete len:185 (-) Transcript_27366:259-813(-)
MIAKKPALLLGVLAAPLTLAFLSAASKPHIRATGGKVKMVPSTVLSSFTYHGPQGQEWIQKSIEYYTKVMRIEDPTTSQLSGTEQSRVAKRLYHAIQQARNGNLSKAENLTIRDIQKLAAEEEGQCRNAELATTTLLLALVHQKMDNYGEARLVFQRFFRQAISMTENDPLTAVMIEYRNELVN